MIDWGAFETSWKLVVHRCQKIVNLIDHSVAAASMRDWGALETSWELSTDVKKELLVSRLRRWRRQVWRDWEKQAGDGFRHHFFTIMNKLLLQHQWHSAAFKPVESCPDVSRAKCEAVTEKNKLQSVFGSDTKVVRIRNNFVATASMTFRSIQTSWELSRCQENSQSVERQRRITSRRRFSRLGPSFRRSRVGAVRRRQQLSIPEFSLTLTAVALRILLILVDPSQRCNRKTQGGPKTVQYFTFDFRWPKHYGVRLELKMNRSALTIVWHTW